MSDTILNPIAVQEVRAYMEREGISQTEMARRVGISQPHLSRILGGAKASAEIFEKMYEAIHGAVRTPLAERDLRVDPPTFAPFIVNLCRDLRLFTTGMESAQHELGKIMPLVVQSRDTSRHLEATLIIARVTCRMLQEGLRSRMPSDGSASRIDEVLDHFQVNRPEDLAGLVASSRALLELCAHHGGPLADAEVMDFAQGAVGLLGHLHKCAQLSGGTNTPADTIGNLFLYLSLSDLVSTVALVCVQFGNLTGRWRVPALLVQYLVEDSKVVDAPS